MTTNGADEWWREYFTPLYREVYEGPLRDRAGTAAETGFLSRTFGRPRAGAALLDIGCGSGRHARAMARAGWEVAGIDRFAHLLHAARPSGRLAAVCADMRALPFADASFAGAWCLFNTFGYFPRAENVRMLRGWARVMRPGARLVMQLPNRAGMARVVRGMPLSQALAPRFVATEQYEYDAKTRSLRGAGAWDLAGRRQEWRLEVALYSPAEITRALDRAGFDIERLVEDYNETPFEPRASAQMIVTARRRSE